MFKYVCKNMYVITKTVHIHRHKRKCIRIRIICWTTTLCRWGHNNKLLFLWLKYVHTHKEFYFLWIKIVLLIQDTIDFIKFIDNFKGFVYGNNTYFCIYKLLELGNFWSSLSLFL